MNKNMIIATVITGVVVALFGGVIWFVWDLQPVDRNSDQTITFAFQSGDSASDLASGLQDKGLVRNATVFDWYVTLRGVRSKLQAGSYDLSPSDSVSDIAEKISTGQIAANKLIIPEGKTVVEIRELASEKGVNTQDFDQALGGQYSNDFLQARPPGATLEGYLFPDSYQVNKPVDAHALIQAMLDNFAAKVNGTDIVARYADEGFKLHEGLTLASIVEKEVPNADDRAMVAQVFMNRMKAGMTLSSDVTVAYAAGQAGKPFDVNLDSPYNTYLHKGLPPGPICNPGIGSMNAVAHPKANDFLYFLADKQGHTHYAKTAAEHQANVKKYLQ